MNLKEGLLNFVESKSAAVATSAGTALSGISSAMEWIPEVLGYAATTIGILLSCVMIYNQWHNGKAERRKIYLETKVLKAKIADIEAAMNLKK